MKSTLNGFLAEGDREKIINAVEEAEKNTSGEIVPMIVPWSSPYPMAPARGSFFLSFFISTAASLLSGNSSIFFFIPLFIFLMIIFYFIIDNSYFLKRTFSFSSEMDEEVSEGAMSAFYESGLYRTRDESGVLIYISILERKVYILADRGINDRLDDTQLDYITGIIVRGIKEKRQCQAVTDAVKELGQILALYFPPREDNTDELTNLIVKDHCCDHEH